jgi:alkylhydroperoxidase/carboxymuconolactone decarboxylase family protein YurZ
MGLNKLAKLILPIDETLALEVLNEMIAAANRSEASTEQGGTGFEADIFKAFAAKNEAQSLLAAQTLTDRLRRIVSLAAVYKQRAEKLTQSVRNSQ